MVARCAQKFPGGCESLAACVLGVFCCCCWAAGEGEAVLERFWGVREAAGFLERLLLLLLCQGLWLLAGIFLLGVWLGV